MNLNQAKLVMLRTHVAALHMGVRANAVELLSPPGVGKSSIIEEMCAQLARETNEPVGLVTEMLATLQSVDVRGFMLPAKGANGTLDTVFSTPPWYPTRANMKVFLPDSTIIPKGAWVDEIPRIGVVFLDEFGQAEDDVKKTAADLLLHGQVGNTRLTTHWRVAAASNRMADRSGVLRALTFLTNRRLALSIDPHLPTWNDWVNALAPELRPHHLTVSFANRQPDLVFRDAVPPGDNPFCTPRTLVLMDRDLRALRSAEDVAREKLPMDGIAREVCAGWIGGGESAQYFTHIRFADELPDIADIERDPARAKLPPARDAQMVCAFMLAHQVNKRNADRVMTYIERLNIEMQVLSIKTINNQDDKKEFMVNTPMFTSWLLTHKDLLIASHA